MYNKNDFSKINDKKVLHKVKKQWVTVSVAMLTLLGTTGLAMCDSSNLVAHADEQSQTTATSSQINHQTNESDHPTSNSNSANDSVPKAVENANSSNDSISNKSSNTNANSITSSRNKINNDSTYQKNNKSNPSYKVSNNNDENDSNETNSTRSNRFATSDHSSVIKNGNQSNPKQDLNRENDSQEASSSNVSNEQNHKTNSTNLATQKSSKAVQDTSDHDRQSVSVNSDAMLKSDVKSINTKNSIANQKSLKLNQVKQNNQITSQQADSDGESNGIKDASIANSNNTPNINNNNAWKNTYQNLGKTLSSIFSNSYNDAYHGYKQGESDFNDYSGSVNYKYDPSTYSNKNIYSQEYQNGYKSVSNDINQGFDDEMNNKADNSSHSDTYNNGVSFADGTKDTINNNYDYSNSNMGYQYGNSDLNFGLQNSDSDNSGNAYKYYPAYRYGVNMQRGFNDSMANSTSNQPQNNSPIDLKAYQDGQQSYQGMRDVLTATSSQNKSLSAYNSAYQIAYNGFNNLNSSNLNNLQQFINGEGQAANQAVHNVIAGQTTPGSYSDSNHQNTYAAAFQAAQDGYNGNNNNQPTSNDKKQYASYLTAQVGRQSVNDSINKVNAKNNPNSDYNNWSSIQKSIYDDTQNAYQNGLNGGSATDISSQKNSEAFNDGKIARAGINAANNHQYSSQPANLTSDQQKAYNNNLGNQAGINDAVNGKNSNPFNNDNPAGKQAYQEAQQAYQNGLNGQDDSSNPVANAAGKASQSGMQDAINGKNNNPYSKDTPAYQAYVNAQDAYQAGYTNTKSSNPVALKNNNAYQAGKASQAGMQDAINGKNDNPYQTNTPEYQAYDNAQKAYQAGMNGNSQDAQKNSDAYQAGQVAKQSINDAANGYNARNTNQYNNNWNVNEQKAYNNAQSLYQAGMNGNSAVSDDQRNSIAYQTGQAAQQGINNAISGNNNNPYNNDPQKSAYANAQKAYQNGLSGQDDSSNPIANNAGKAAQQGLNNIINGNNNNPYQTNTPEYQAYVNAQKAYQNGLTGKNDSSNSVANNAGKAANQGANDAANGKNNNPYQLNTPEYQAYNNAQKAYQAGIYNQTNGDGQKNLIAYEAGQSAQAGTQDAIQGKPNNSKYDNNDNPAIKNAYDNARKAYQDGYEGKSNSKINFSAYEAGQSAKQGTNDAVNGYNARTAPNSSYNSWNNSQRQAYDAAQTAFQAGDDGDTNNPSVNSNPDAYQAGQAYRKGRIDASNGNNHDDYSTGSREYQAYQRAQQDYHDGINHNGDKHNSSYNDGQAAKDGIYDAIQGHNYQSNYDPNSSAYRAYINAQSNYKKGLNNQTINSNSSTAYQVGQAGYKGLENAVNGNYDNPYSNDPEKIAYIKSQAAFQAGYNPTNNDQVIKQANPNSYAAGQAARQGTTDAINNQTVHPSFDNPLIQNAYDNARTAYQAGYNGEDDHSVNAVHNLDAYKIGQMAKKGITDAIQGKNDSLNSDSDYNKATPNQKKAYDNAQLSYQAGLQNDANNSNAKHNPDAYQAGQAARQGILDGGLSQNNRNYSNSNDQDAYDNARTAYQAGMQNESADDSDAKQNPTAYATGQAARRAMNDAFKHQDHNPYSSGLEQVTYDNVQSAYQAGMNNQPTNSVAAQKNPAAYQSGQAAYQGMNDAIAGKNDTPKNENYDEQKAYEQAQAAYQAGVNNDQQNPVANYNPAAYQAGQIAEQGTKDAINHNPEQHFNSTSENQAYQNARNAYEAGFKGDNVNSSSAQNNLNSYYAGQAAKQAINDATAMRDARTNPNSGYNSWNHDRQQAYNNAQAAYHVGLNDDNPNNSDAQKSPEAYETGKAIRQGINDALSDWPQNNNYADPAQQGNYQAAYQAAKTAQDQNNLPNPNASAHQIAIAAGQAAKTGLKDIENGRNAKNDPNSYYQHWTTSQQKAYDDAQRAYQAGINGNINSDEAKANPDASRAGYNNYLEAQQAATNANNDRSHNMGQQAGSNDFTNGLSSNPSQQDPIYRKAYDDSYNQAQNGFIRGLDHEPRNSDDTNYTAGYQAANDYQNGLDDVMNKHSNRNLNPAYNIGYQSYLDGLAGHKMNLNNLNPAYQNAYKHGYAVGQELAKNQMIEHNKMNKKAKNYHRLTIPRYVYNIAKMYRYDNADMNRKNRVMKYRHTVRHNRHVFKVLGYKFNAKGQMMYRVRGGWIKASRRQIRDAYYRHSHTGADNRYIKIIKSNGTYVYNNKQFAKQHIVRFLKKGTKVRVHGAIKLSGITRFYIGNGEYISSNKTIVRETR